MNLSKISRNIFLENAKLRGEGKKKRKAPAKKATKKKVMGGITIGGKKKAPAKKTAKRKLPAGARAWLDLVKQVYAQGGMSWKQALQQASKIYKKM
jgi:hypothetical protein